MSKTNDDDVFELMQSRIEGEDEEHFYAREVRQKANRYLEASANLEVGKEHRCNSDIMYNLDRAFRHSRLMLTGTVASLQTELTKAAPKGAER